MRKNRPFSFHWLSFVSSVSVCIYIYCNFLTSYSWIGKENSHFTWKTSNLQVNIYTCEGVKCVWKDPFSGFICENTRIHQWSFIESFHGNFEWERLGNESDGFMGNWRTVYGINPRRLDEYSRPRLVLFSSMDSRFPMF